MLWCFLNVFYHIWQNRKQKMNQLHFDNQASVYNIFQAKIIDVLCFQLKCGDLFLFSVLCHYKVNIFGFCTVDQTENQQTFENVIWGLLLINQ